ncbi:hypothetical protein HUJ04_000594 [Dendroctonus ponderosae]|nr:hypothetical protein HUJ04_000594 [Dendroctonus ponderosae]
MRDDYEKLAGISRDFKPNGTRPPEWTFKRSQDSWQSTSQIPLQQYKTRHWKNRKDDGKE